ncbi:MAG: S8 family serine peptidase [Alphaproteobacteria bacterium]|nr:S8 family serine peptidase [Alphaproteobacteria bacterium]MBV9904491.1 S8 family serine peptidase [Alphaproteobacteria bacterium]
MAWLCGVVGAGLVAFAPAQAAGLGGVVGLPGPIIGDVGRGVGRIGDDLSRTVDGVTRDLVGRPTDRSAFERDPAGGRIARHTIVAVAPTDADLAAAARLGFDIRRRDTLGDLGFAVVVLETPDGMATTDALARLRAAAPEGTFDFDHLYDPSGGTSSAGTGASLAAADAHNARVGMIDGGIARRHAVFRNATLVTENVAGDGTSPPTAHGTAVASLLVGSDSDFSGCLPGAPLYAADVFGGKATGGGAIEIARALDWLAKSNVQTVNISLAGPANKLLELAVRRFLARGGVLVAAVGNEGPAAPAAFPASYSGVYGVTSVDSSRHLQFDANSSGVAFAALGVGVRAAKLDRGYSSVTGTSFAAPIVTARFALLLAGGARPDAALHALQSEAQPLPGARYGYLAPVYPAPVATR